MKKFAKFASVCVAAMITLAPAMGWAEEAATAPVIDPEAETVLRQLSEHNKGVKTAKFTLTDTIDDVQEDGQKLQFAHVREFTISRPDKLKIVTKGDLTNRTLWMDGKKVTVLDREHGVYAEVAHEGSIESAVDLLQEKFDMSLPAADLLTSDVYKSITEGAQTIDYVGLGYVGEEECHHLAFSREDIDWQMWISQGKKAMARKIVITYKLIPGSPQYTLQVLKADPRAKAKDSEFKADVPKDAEKIEFHPVDPQT